MDYLILDTNIYISFYFKRKPYITPPCLKYLKELLDENRIKIILPEIIRTEFLRNFVTIFDRSEIIINEAINKIDKIIFPHNIHDGLRQETISKLNEILSTFESVNIKKEIKPVLELMDHENTDTIPNSDDLLLKTIKRIFDGLAPAHNKRKRNEADCLIIESALSYLRTVNDNESTFFITHDKADFTNPENKNEIHPDLKERFKELDIDYDPILSELLKVKFGKDINEVDIENEKELIKMRERVAVQLTSPYASVPFEFTEVDSLYMVPSPSPSPEPDDDFLKGEGMV